MSTPKWELTIDCTDVSYTDGPSLNVWIVRGAGPKPILVDLVPPLPPVDPADPPPVKPPVGDPLAPQPGEDTSPFAFPTGGPTWPTDPNGDRNYPLGLELPAKDLYACEMGAGNPSIMSHANAGQIAAGGQTDYGDQRPKAVGGMRLWVRVTAGEVDGQMLPPTPAHLIRRALAKGRL